MSEPPSVVADTGVATFEDYVTLRSASLLRFAYLITRNRDDAHDAVQEALTGLYPRWRQVSAPWRSAPQQWVSAVCCREPSLPGRSQPRSGSSVHTGR